MSNLITLQKKKSPFTKQIRDCLIVTKAFPKGRINAALWKKRII
jgi:hypothetical protein